MVNRVLRDYEIRKKARDRSSTLIMFFTEIGTQNAWSTSSRLAEIRNERENDTRDPPPPSPVIGTRVTSSWSSAVPDVRYMILDKMNSIAEDMNKMNSIADDIKGIMSNQKQILSLLVESLQVLDFNIKHHASGDFKDLPTPPELLDLNSHEEEEQGDEDEQEYGYVDYLDTLD